MNVSSIRETRQRIPATPRTQKSFNNTTHLFKKCVCNNRWRCKAAHALLLKNAWIRDFLLQPKVIDAHWFECLRVSILLERVMMDGWFVLTKTCANTVARQQCRPSHSFFTLDLKKFLDVGVLTITYTGFKKSKSQEPKYGFKDTCIHNLASNCLTPDQHHGQKLQGNKGSEAYTSFYWWATFLQLLSNVFLCFLFFFLKMSLSSQTAASLFGLN